MEDQIRKDLKCIRKARRSRTVEISDHRAVNRSQRDNDLTSEIEKAIQDSTTTSSSDHRRNRQNK